MYSQTHFTAKKNKHMHSMYYTQAYTHSHISTLYSNSKTKLTRQQRLMCSVKCLI